MAASLQVAVQYLAISSFFANPAHAFFPTIIREMVAGNGGVSHEKITNDMYDQKVMEYFPEIKIVSTGMTKARKVIAKANIAVDSTDAELTASHFDGENFEGGQARLLMLFQEVIDRLDEDNAEEAQKAFGGALHTLQDFYAHTNWIELGNLGPHPQLGRKGETITGIAGPLEQTCNNCGPHNPIDTGTTCQDCRNNTVGFSSLTSGFYFNEDIPVGGNDAILPFKCHHGGYSDNSMGGMMGIIFGPPNPGINKDSNNCGWSPHFWAHRLAAEVALQASNQFLDDLKAELEPVKLKQLLGIGPTLALAVDTTGSMSGVISAVRQQCLAIVEDRAGTADEPTSYVLSPFNDPSIGPLTVTSDRAVFEAAINNLFASGGGDCPELSIAGMIAAVEELDGGSLFMFTDAAAKDEGRVSELITKANAKAISIYVFKFDSGCDDGAASKIKKRGDSASNRVYGEITLATGGQYRSLPVSDAESISGLIETLTTSNNRYILKIEDTFGETGTTLGGASFKVPVDSRMTRVTFSASGTELGMQIRTPNGTRLDLGAPNVNSQVLSDGEFVIITDPVVGIYTVLLSGTSGFSLDVTGSDPLSFSAFDVVEGCGRSGHRGYCPIDGPPAYDHDVGAVATIDGGFLSAVFEIRNTTGKTVLTIPMEAGSGEFAEPPTNVFFGQFRYPQGQFYVYVSGRDVNNSTYQRLLPSLIVPFASGTNDTGLVDEYVFSNTTIPDTNSTVPGLNTTAPGRNSSTTAPTVLPTSPSNSTTMATVIRTPGVAPPGVAHGGGGSSSSSTPFFFTDEPSFTPPSGSSTAPSVTPTSPVPRVTTPGVAVAGVAPGGGAAPTA